MSDGDTSLWTKIKQGKEAWECRVGGVTVLYRVVTKLTWEGTFIQRPIGSEGAKPRSCLGPGGKMF